MTFFVSCFVHFKDRSSRHCSTVFEAEYSPGNEKEIRDLEAALLLEALKEEPEATALTVNSFQPL